MTTCPLPLPWIQASPRLLLDSQKKECEEFYLLPLLGLISHEHHKNLQSHTDTTDTR